MKAILRLRGKICPEKQRSAVGYELSVLPYQLPARSWLIPKTYYLIPILFLVFVSCSAALAQEPVVSTAPAAKAEITPLNIGDKIPDELWEMYFPVVSANSDEVQYLSLGDFKDKLIILDFWATWCAPCISSLHKLDTLLEQFKDDLMVIPTSYETDDKILSFLSDRKINLPSLIEETELKEYFPHQSVPYQVWIKNGQVLAMTGSEYARLDNIAKIIDDKEVKMLMKIEDMSIDTKTPILNETDLLYSTAFSRRVNADISGVKRASNSLSAYNVNYFQIIKEAFITHFTGIEFSKRIIWEVGDSLKNQLVNGNSKFIGDFEEDIKYMEWLEDNTYCYNVTLSDGFRLQRPYLYQVLRNESNQFFRLNKGVEFELAKRNKDCLVLIKMEHYDPSSNLKNRLQNRGSSQSVKIGDIRKLLSNLRITLKDLSFPIVDNTDLYNEAIYVELKEGNSNLEDLRKQLNVFGLDLVEKNILTDVVIVKPYNKS